MRNCAKHHLSLALPGTALTPGPQSSTWCPPRAVTLPISSLYSPSGHSTHSKQQVGFPSMIPFLVPARQTRLQLEKGTWKMESTKVRGCSCGICLTAPLSHIRGRSWAQGPVWQTLCTFQAEDGPETLPHGIHEGEKCLWISKYASAHTPMHTCVGI